MFGISPWLIVGVLVSILLAGWQGYEMGKDRGENICNQRVAVIQQKINDANAEIEKIKKENQEKIDQIIADNDAKNEQREAENDVLEKKLFETESKYAGATTCLLDKSTTDELR